MLGSRCCFKKKKRKSPSRFYAMLRKFLSDFNEICTLWWRPHNQSCGSRRQIIIFKIFSSLVSISHWKISNQGHRLDEITQRSPNYGRMPYWGRPWIVYGPIFMNMFYWDFLGSGSSLLFAGSNHFDTPCITTKWYQYFAAEGLGSHNSKHNA